MYFVVWEDLSFDTAQVYPAWSIPNHASGLDDFDGILSLWRGIVDGVVSDRRIEGASLLAGPTMTLVMNGCAISTNNRRLSIVNT